MARTTTTKDLQYYLSKLKAAEIRFIHLYLGGEGGACWNNATKAYAVAYDKDLDNKSEYNTCRANGARLLANASIQEYRTFLLTKHGYTEDAIKARFGQLSVQDSNLGVALASTDRMAKIAGVIKDDGLKVDIPELTRLGEGIKAILEGNSHPKKKGKQKHGK